MKLSLTLSSYLTQNYLINTLAMLLGLLSIIYLFDTVELIRRASKVEGLSFILILQMGLLKLPEVGQILFPFAILFSAMFTFWQLNRRSELVVLRSAGFSAWQFITPVMLLALAIGIFQIAALNPLSALLIGKYEQLENKYLDNQDNEIALFSGGLWLRQTIDGTRFDENTDLEQGYVILNARKIDQKNWMLKDVTALYFGKEDTLLMRLDAEEATLEKGRWLFQNVHTYQRNNKTEVKQYYALPTQLTIHDIEESFSSPAAMSFWNLPSHIRTLEETGFDAIQLRVHYQSLLSQPLFLAAMVLLAASVAMRPPRNGGGLILFASGIFMGFMIFFISSYLQAMGYSNQIPPALSAWAPVALCWAFGLTLLINLEEG